MQITKSIGILGLGLIAAGAVGCAGTYDGPYRGASSNASASTSDAAITARVESTLANDRNLNVADSRVNIRTKDGHVELSGNVPTERDKQEAADAASRVPGVARVDNDIKVG